MIRLSPKLLSKWMKLLLSMMLIVFAAILSAFLIRETWHLLEILLNNRPDNDAYQLIEAIIIWFLYFEFIALIAKYFDSKFHFPLRYFIYIGITAIVRLIIVDHEKPMATLTYSFAILVLLGALYVANTNALRRI